MENVQLTHVNVRVKRAAERAKQSLLYAVIMGEPFEWHPFLYFDTGPGKKITIYVTNLVGILIFFIHIVRNNRSDRKSNPFTHNNFQEHLLEDSVSYSPVHRFQCTFSHANVP